MKMHKPGTVVVVKWDDANSQDDWANLVDRLAEHDIPSVVITVGIVLKHTDEYIVIARSYQEIDSIVEGSFQILSGMIKSIKKLNYPLIDIPFD